MAQRFAAIHRGMVWWYQHNDAMAGVPFVLWFESKTTPTEPLCRGRRLFGTMPLKDKELRKEYGRNYYHSHKTVLSPEQKAAKKLASAEKRKLKDRERKKKEREEMKALKKKVELLEKRQSLQEKHDESYAAAFNQTATAKAPEENAKGLTSADAKVQASALELTAAIRSLWSDDDSDGSDEEESIPMKRKASQEEDKSSKKKKKPAAVSRTSTRAAVAKSIPPPPTQGSTTKKAAPVRPPTLPKWRIPDHFADWRDEDLVEEV